MNKIVVYTAIFGGYDSAPRVVKEHGVDYLLFTDTYIESDVWDVIVVTNSFGSNANANRHFKFGAHIHLQKYDCSLYIDGSINIIRPLKKVVFHLLKDNDVVLHHHPFSNCIEDEVVPLVKHEKITLLDLSCFYKQRSIYYKEGFRYTRFAEAGIIYRNHNKSSVIQFSKIWQTEFDKYLPRDQLSVMYCLWLSKVKYKIIEESKLRSGSGLYSFKSHNVIRQCFFNKLINRLVLLPLVVIIESFMSRFIKVIK